MQETALATEFSASQFSAKDWQDVQQKLRHELGDAAYNSWLAPVELLAAKLSTSGQTHEVVLAVPTNFMRNWIESRYGDRIRNIIKARNAAITNVVFKLADLPDTEKPALPSAEKPLAASNPIPAQTAAAPTIDESEKLLHTGIRLDERFSFDNFVVGKSNELAFAAARRVAEAQEVSFNPLFLYGGVGLGKTHLMNAIARHIEAHDPTRRILYLSAEKFMYEFIRALRFKDTMSFKEQFRSVDVLMIDDVQFISGKDSTQEEFFHTFNALVDQDRQVIISADKSPSDLEGMEERLKSRLGWGLVADIHPAGYELRLGILQAKAASLPVIIPNNVLEFLAANIASNVRELEGALNKIAAHATLIGNAVTLEHTKKLLGDVLRNAERKITIDVIQNKVAAFYNIRISDMQSARRARVYARPRQVAMYLSKVLTAHSLPEIGRQFGGRDHTTVMHAVRTIERTCEIDPDYRAEVQRLRLGIEG